MGTAGGPSTASGRRVGPAPRRTVSLLVVAALLLATELLGIAPGAGERAAGASSGDPVAVTGPRVAADGHQDARLTAVDVFERRVLADRAGDVEPLPSVPVVAPATSGPACVGTGSDGRRVQAVFAHVAETPDPVDLATVAAAVAQTDDTFSASAAASGGTRRVRWVTTSGASCQVTVLTVRISATAALAATTSGGLFDELVTKGLSNPTRRYLVWTEGNIEFPVSSTCGVGEYFGDDRPGAANANANPDGTWGPTFGAVDERCWNVANGHSVPAHELMHMLGAVQDSAPHADGTGHCTDDYDAMCYGPWTQVVPGCTSPSQEALFDCNGDDYFHTAPSVGSYLCDRWNTARNPYLDGVPVLGAPPPPTSVTAAPEVGAVTVRWAASPTCPRPDTYRVAVAGGAQTEVAGTATSVRLAAPAGPVTVSVVPVRDGLVGATASLSTTVPATPPPRSPVGQIVYWGTDGRRLSMFGYALDPDLDVPLQVVLVVDGVGVVELTADVGWDEVPRRHPGFRREHAFLRGVDLPPGDHEVCALAADATGGPSTNLGCFRVSVK